MIIKTLIENTSVSADLASEHGLSLYIETGSRKILFDTGAGALFTENARKLQVDLSEVDTVVISHGHYDHGGGLRAFMDINSKAKIYLSQKAFGKYYSERSDGEKRYIGLDQTLSANDRFIFTSDSMILNEDMELFSNVERKRINPSANKDLFMKVGASFLPDDFSHEQNLIIREGGNNVLFAGCAHSGIINILEHFLGYKGYFPSHVIGGFHLYSRSTGRSEDDTAVSEIGRFLIGTEAEFYTCHCTGISSYEKLKSMMGKKNNCLSTGIQLII